MSRVTQPATNPATRPQGTMLPHLHFHVITVDHVLVPVTFADLESDSGIPRMFKRYTSGNYAK
jgi:hypothetical protein